MEQDEKCTLKVLSGKLSNCVSNRRLLPISQLLQILVPNLVCTVEKIDGRLLIVCVVKVIAAVFWKQRQPPSVRVGLSGTSPRANHVKTPWNRLQKARYASPCAPTNCVASKQDRNTSRLISSSLAEKSTYKHYLPSFGSLTFFKPSTINSNMINVSFAVTRNPSGRVEDRREKLVVGVICPNIFHQRHILLTPHEKSAQKAFIVLRMIRRTFSRIIRMDFQILYAAFARPLLEYTDPIFFSGCTKDVILIERVQRAATKMVAGLKSMDYETRTAVFDLLPLEYRRLRGDLILTYALFGQDLANRGKVAFVKRLTIESRCQCKRRFLQDPWMDFVGPKLAAYSPEQITDEEGDHSIVFRMSHRRIYASSFETEQYDNINNWLPVPDAVRMMESPELTQGQYTALHCHKKPANEISPLTYDFR
ncbi:hypothetical protein CLF_106548 [Clonorchis sinensis]|uniref:Pol-related protein n=1 Tax=Clonorchis sinensis TaxID=79923 RepID=G7YFB6_CLOSI|nr:hypothetical protein CLF_106548 [Clonorchis sinensis]